MEDRIAELEERLDIMMSAFVFELGIAHFNYAVAGGATPELAIQHSLNRLSFLVDSLGVSPEEREKLLSGGENMLKNLATQGIALPPSPKN
jgi:hypothetical protein